MRAVRRGVLALLFASVLLTGAVGHAVAGVDRQYHGEDGTQPSVAATTDGPDINVTQAFALRPSKPGTVQVTLRFDVPNRIFSMQTTVPEGATVTNKTGFSHEEGRSYRWDGATTQPTLRYTLAVNESLNDTNESASGDTVAVDTGEWALFQRPSAPVQWKSYQTEEPVEYNVATTTDGPGATGEWLVFLGDHETYEKSAHDQQFRLVVPSNANMTAPPPAVLASLADTSNALRVGDRDSEVFVVAAPTDDVQWGARGLQTGEADLWVRDTEPVASADNAWVHEYVHTRQAFDLGPDLQWFREASASYYAALLTYEQGYVGYDAFSERIDAGANSSYRDAVLANQSTWQGRPQYDKGALVAGQLDRQIRNERDQERTLQAVFRAVNEHQDRTTLADFLDYLGEYGDQRIAESGEQYAETSDNVSNWNRTAHVTAFGDTPARIGFQLPSDSNGGTYGITGAYRNTTLDGDDPIVVVPGEELRVGTRIENAGGQSGNYIASLAVNGTVVDRTAGSVGPNETVRSNLTHAFETPGRYRLSLAGDTRTVQVREPATPRVTGLRATSGEVWKGESVGVSARIENDDPLPGRVVVEFRRDDGLVVSEVARVGPESATWLNATVPTSRTGTTTVTVDTVGSVKVAVRAPLNQTTRGSTSTTETPDGSTTRSTAPPTTDPTTTAPTERPVTGGRGLGFGYTVTLGIVIVAAVALLRGRW